MAKEHTKDALCRCRACKPPLPGHSPAVTQMLAGQPQRRTYRDSEAYIRSHRLDRAGQPVWPITRSTIAPVARR